MPRRALLVGIDHYANIDDLNFCVKDVKDLAPLLAWHEKDEHPNFHVHMLTSRDTKSPEKIVTHSRLRAECEELFSFDDMVLFYFSGHGVGPRNYHNGWLVTQDGSAGQPGLALHELISMANHSPAKSVTIILDSCFAGALGDSVYLPDRHVQLDEGVTVLAASKRFETAIEERSTQHGLFTRLLIEGLEGAAADLTGRVHAASLYAHISRGLGPWSQRPVFKSNVTHLRSIRRLNPSVSLGSLQRIAAVFEKIETRKTIDGKAKDLAFFESLRNARLAEIEPDKSTGKQIVSLTRLGHSYWNSSKHYLRSMHDYL